MRTALSNPKLFASIKTLQDTWVFASPSLPGKEARQGPGSTQPAFWHPSRGPVASSWPVLAFVDFGPHCRPRLAAAVLLPPPWPACRGAWHLWAPSHRRGHPGLGLGSAISACSSLGQRSLHSHSMSPASVVTDLPLPFGLPHLGPMSLKEIGICHLKNMLL